MKLLQLKIKIVSLALEARYIRQQEQKLIPCRSLRKKYRNLLKNNSLTDKDRKRINEELGKARSETRQRLRKSLKDHRTIDIRTEARSAQIAYAFLRGKKYSVLEQPRDDNQPNYSRIARIISKFGGEEVTVEQVKNWMNEV